MCLISSPRCVVQGTFKKLTTGDIITLVEQSMDEAGISSRDAKTFDDEEVDAKFARRSAP